MDLLPLFFLRSWASQFLITFKLRELWTYESGTFMSFMLHESDISVLMLVQTACFEDLRPGASFGSGCWSISSRRSSGPTEPITGRAPITKYSLSPQTGYQASMQCSEDELARYWRSWRLSLDTADVRPLWSVLALYGSREELSITGLWYCYSVSYCNQCVSCSLC